MIHLYSIVFFLFHFFCLWMFPGLLLGGGINDVDAAIVLEFHLKNVSNLRRHCIEHSNYNQYVFVNCTDIWNIANRVVFANRHFFVLGCNRRASQVVLDAFLCLLFKRLIVIDWRCRTFTVSEYLYPFAYIKLLGLIASCWTRIHAQLQT